MTKKLLLPNEKIGENAKLQKLTIRPVFKNVRHQSSICETMMQKPQIIVETASHDRKS